MRERPSRSRRHLLRLRPNRCSGTRLRRRPAPNRSRRPLAAAGSAAAAHRTPERCRRSRSRSVAGRQERLRRQARTMAFGQLATWQRGSRNIRLPSPPFSRGSWSARRCPAYRAGKPRSAMRGHRASGSTHSVRRRAPPFGSHPGARPLRRGPQPYSLIRFSSPLLADRTPGRDAGRDPGEKGGLSALSLLEAIIGQHLFDRTGRRGDVPGQKKSDSAADDEQEDDDENFQRDVLSLLNTRRR